MQLKYIISPIILTFGNCSVIQHLITCLFCQFSLLCYLSFCSSLVSGKYTYLLLLLLALLRIIIVHHLYHYFSKLFPPNIYDTHSSLNKFLLSTSLLLSYICSMYPYIYLFTSLIKSMWQYLIGQDPIMAHNLYIIFT